MKQPGKTNATTKIVQLTRSQSVSDHGRTGDHFSEQAAGNVHGPKAMLEARVHGAGINVRLQKRQLRYETQALKKRMVYHDAFSFLKANAMMDGVAQLTGRHTAASNHT
jgi:hypothetical protein